MARTRAAATIPKVPGPLPPSGAERLADLALIALFLALVFLLGVFPLKDTDFWWHLRAGDLIRQTGRIPDTDPFTFGAEGHRWIDLHWLFQVALSRGHEYGGVVFLNLAKCVVTCAAMLLLISAGRREWPVWAMILAWTPALYVLGGRMYVRPETLTLLYLAADLAILTRWDRVPKLAWLLPVVQLLWVNTQGLFVFGPILIALALIDAALQPGSFSAGRRPWWRTVLMATAATALACVFNPYGLIGALYPLQLLRTMGDPVFKSTIAELMPVRTFVEQTGLRNFQIQMYLATVVLGALSFLTPLIWRILARLSPERPKPAPAKQVKPAKTKRRRKTEVGPVPVTDSGWPLRPFRLLLYVVFVALSLQATRNSHQFAAVVGAVTAWNFGEWAAAVRRRRLLLAKPDLGFGVVPRIATFACLTLAIVTVASGKLYAIAGEGRTVGLDEEPLWFPKQAVAFAGQEGMPTRFVCFHNGHAALYEYLNRSYGKVYTDARLEVMGPELYGRYIDLERQISRDQGGWRQELDALGKPGILVDTVHAESSPLIATLLLDPAWRCVWFDPIAAVFVPEGTATRFPAVDFAARHFQPDPETDPRGPSALLASSKALRNVVSVLHSRRRADRADPLILLGQGHARRALAIHPGTADGWKWLGQLEWSREQLGETPAARFRKPFDPTFDLIFARTTYALRRALELSSDDFSTLISLMMVYQARMMNQETLQVMERLSGLSPINPSQAALLDHLPIEIARLRAALGPEPAEGWKNLSDLNAHWNARLDAGRVAAAAELLERAYRVEGRPWTVTDRLATLWLHLGQPRRARTAWQGAIKPPRPALVSARAAVTYLVEGDFDAARSAFHDALTAEPDLFEAHYALAVLERDAGRAVEALASARAAVEHAPTDVAKAAADRLVAEVKLYAGSDPAHP